MPDFLAEVLTWPKNYSYALAVQTAMEWKLPPTVMLQTGKQPTEGWSREDKKLAMAWTIMEKETCSQCGKPLWICRSSSKDLLFKVKKDVCYASRELEKWQDTKAGKDLKKGERAYVVAEMRLPEQKMPTRREYLEELAE